MAYIIKTLTGGGGTGSTGPQGFQGTQGNQGTAGMISGSGSQGWQGFQGIQGVQGWQGIVGFQGVSGTGSQNLEQVTLLGNTTSNGLRIINSTFSINNSISGTTVSVSINNSINLLNQESTNSGGLIILPYSTQFGSSNTQYTTQMIISPTSSILTSGTTQIITELDKVRIVSGTTSISSNLYLSLTASSGATTSKALYLDPSGRILYGTVSGGFGAQGWQGLQGNVGNQGPQGWQGLIGFQGNQGFIGATGATGFQGFQGRQGFQGNQGWQGLIGVTGSGVQGFQGLQGFQGAAGSGTGSSNDTLNTVSVRGGTTSVPLGLYATLSVFKDIVINSNSTIQGQYAKVLKVYSSNLTGGDTVQLAFGYANSNLNQAEFNFYWDGNGSTNNSLGLGLWGQPGMITLKGDGVVGILTDDPIYTLDVNGNGRFLGRVKGLTASANDEFVTLSQLNSQSSGGFSTASITNYLASLPGFVGDGSKVLSDDFTWISVTGSGGIQLMAPILSIGTVSSTFIRLNWTFVTNSTDYILQSSTNSGSSWNTLYSGSVLSYTHSSLSSGRGYGYRIKAVGDIGYSDSSYSTPIYATTSMSAPVLNYTNLGTSSVTITWGTVSGATNYILERATQSSYTQIYSGSTTNYNDSGLLISTLYNYRAKAQNASSESSYGTMSVTTLTQGVTVNVGSGSGNLEITHENYTINPGDTVIIAPGTYGYIYFDLQGTDDARITVKNGAGVVNTERLDSGYTSEAPRNITISGDGWAGATHGIWVKDSNYKGTVIEHCDKSYRNFTMQWIRYDNISDYCIDFRDAIAYNAGDELNTVYHNIKLLHLYYRQCSQTNFGGDWNVDTVQNTGLYRGLEVAYCEWHDCPDCGAAVWAANLEFCNIHHNILDGVNLNLTNHNGIFTLNGNGAFHHNKSTNHQGNLVRFWPHRIGTPGTCSLYNNIVWNSLKYGAFEVQGFDYKIDNVSGYYCDMYCDNNTVGQLNTIADWQAAVIDKYNMFGGHLYVRNNLSFNTYMSNGGDHIINYAGAGSDDETKTNNLYFATYSTSFLISVGTNESFKPGSTSSVVGAGTASTLTYISNDYYDVTRPNPPAIGAVEP